MTPPLPVDEENRLRDLLRLEILDTDSEACFDRITRLASTLTGAPISLISLLDRKRQWFKSRVGLEASATPRRIAFCNYAIAADDTFVVLDARQDPRFSGNPLVTDAPHVRFYAGAPLKRAEGSALGTLCVMDTEPRLSFSATEGAILNELAGLVTDLMEQRLVLTRAETSRRAQEYKASARRKLKEAVRQTQSLFIAGAEPDAVFGELLRQILPLTGSKAACIASAAVDSSKLAPSQNDQLRICACVGAHGLMPLMESALKAGRVLEEGRMIALPAFHGDRIEGVIGFEQESFEGLADIRVQSDCYLDSMAALFVASRARNEGRQNARAIRLRDRALASISSGVSIVDPAQPGGTILYVNAALETMSGYRAEELAGREFGFMHGPDTNPDSIALIGKALLKGVELDIVIRSYHRDGSSFWNRIRLSPVKDEQGRVEFFVSVGNDVTEKIADNEELLRAKEEAEKQARLTSRFMANMSHEIRTPMNGVIGMTGLLLDSALTEEQREYAETIRSSGEGLLTIINEILDFSRIDSGTVKLEIAEFDICDCIESSMDLVASSASRKGIELEYLLDRAVPKTVLADSTRLRQVLINLLGNAVKFTSEGKVLLSVSGSCLASSAESDRNWDIHFAVQDTGIGIPEAQRSEIFQPFRQADNSSTRGYGGTGLGLSISKHLTELMGGRMWVESEVGKGSTFHFTIRAEAHAPAHPVDMDEDLGLKGRRVLVLDPNTGSQAVLRQHLQAWGMRPCFCASLDETNSLIEPHAFDLLIVDNDLPGLSPVEIRRLTGDAPVLVLCSLGHRNSGLAEQFRGSTSPRWRLHSKPIKPSYLCETLVAFLSGAPFRVAQHARISSSDPEFATRLPYTILVVEDNPVNQKLVLLLLGRLGYRADTANNGREGCTALQSRPYDVVFMDMHMPEMDGVEATRRIREMLPPDKQPWIISLTASAMQSDRDLCLGAGMQALITKPVQSADLKKALLEVRRAPAVHPADITAQATAVSQCWQVPEYFTELTRDDPSVAAELIQLFESETAARIAELRDSVSIGNRERSGFLLHGLKGSSAQMGALAMSDCCLRMEGDLDTLSLADRVQATEEIAQCFESLKERMNRYSFLPA